VASKFGYGPKHVRVRAEHENELTVLVKHERAIQEHEIEKRERSGWVIGGSAQNLAATILVIGTGSFASFNEQSNSGIEREREARGFS
jgi:hypothetical protein